LLPSVSRVSRQCGSLKISQPYRPCYGDSFTLTLLHDITFHSCSCEKNFSIDMLRKMVHKCYRFHKCLEDAAVLAVILTSLYFSVPFRTFFAMNFLR
jgi:hypothetical protein